jgi:peptide/nickel transport system permease protein
MGKYILKRIGYMLIVLLILSFLMFLLYNAASGDRAYVKAYAEVKEMKNITAEQRQALFDETYLQYQREYGTDNPNKIVQYLRWMGFYPYYDGQFNGLLQGNFGYSDYYRDDVLNVVKAPMKNTIFINIFATILALAITIPLGIHCAVKRGKAGDKIMQVLTIIGYSLPTFLISLLFIWLFCSKLGIFPPSGMKTPGSNYTGFRAFIDEMYYLALPLIVMTFCSLGGMTRYVRASMIDALSMDCIKTARAKGLKEKVIIYSHAWRNALIPIVTLVVGWFLGIFSGSVVIEQIFNINGMGKVMIDALNSSDNDLILLMQLFYVLIALAGNLIIDIVYGLVDPRVRVNK